MPKIQKLFRTCVVLWCINKLNIYNLPLVSLKHHKNKLEQCNLVADKSIKDFITFFENFY